MTSLDVMGTFEHVELVQLGVGFSGRLHFEPSSLS